MTSGHDGGNAARPREGGHGGDRDAAGSGRSQESGVHSGERDPDRGASEGLERAEAKSEEERTRRHEAEQIGE
jgi:hypothetical protein